MNGMGILNRLLCIMRFKFMNIKYLSIAIGAVVMISGCTNRQIYETTQPKYNETECMKLPKSQYDECIRREAQSYEEYEKERKEITNE